MQTDRRLTWQCAGIEYLCHVEIHTGDAAVIRGIFKHSIVRRRCPCKEGMLLAARTRATQLIVGNLQGKTCWLHLKLELRGHIPAI